MSWFGILVLVIIFIVIILLLVVGNYFYTIALSAKSDWFATTGHTMLNPDIVQDDDDPHAKKEKEQNDIAYHFWEKERTALPQIKSHDGLKLVANEFEIHPENNQWIIAMHGFRSSAQRDMGFPTVKFTEAGYNVLAPEQRAHGLSEGESIGMGALEKFDTVRWVNYLVDKNPNVEIILFGGSMGAATVLMASGETLPSNVKAIAADCGYTNAGLLFEDLVVNALNLPVFPILPAANFITKIRAKFDLYKTSSLDALKMNERPILIIHGDEDKFVPFEMGEEIYAAITTEKEFFHVPGAPHFASYIYEETAYFEKVLGYFKKQFSK